MSTWFEHSARRLVVAGALAFAVGAPTLACMGGGGTTEEDGGGADDGGADDGGADEASKSAHQRSVGTWQVQPSKEDMRQLKILNMALNPKIKEAQFKQKLKPPPSNDELALFRQVKQVPPNSPDAQLVRMQIKMMKESRLTITEAKWTMEMGGDKQEWSYTVVSDSPDTVKVKLDSGEESTLKFVNDNKIHVTLVDQGKTMELQFARK